MCWFRGVGNVLSCEDDVVFNIWMRFHVEGAALSELLSGDRSSAESALAVVVEEELVQRRFAEGSVGS